MKNLVSLFLLTVSVSASAQFYTEFEMPNIAKTDVHEVIIETGEPWYLLIDNNVQPPKVYYLSNSASSTYNAPTNLPQGWSLNTVYKPNKQIYHIKVGDYFVVVNDSNYNSYNAFH